MSLLDLWKKSPEQLQAKQVQQLIAFAGAGRLLDGSTCSVEFRTFLSGVPSEYLGAYTEQCLSPAFPDSGLALQDVVNEIGSRLGAKVTSGNYRGGSKKPGLDGLWDFPSGHGIVIEVKTTDAYRVDLNTIAGYRRRLIEEQRLDENKSSMLLVVGRQDTGDLEAQIRGSRYAWDLRIISAAALLRLLAIKEELEDPAVVQRIHSILVPREFTRLDEIADVLFSAAEGVKAEETLPIDEEGPIAPVLKVPKFRPVAFNEACAARVQIHLGVQLVKRSPAGYSSPDQEVAVNCSVSKEHNPETNPNYWFAFHPHQREFLKQHPESFVAFGCGSSQRLILIPFTIFETWLDGAWTTVDAERMYWHVCITREGNHYLLRRRRSHANIDLTPYLLDSQT